MAHNWILDVLADLKAYARKNDLRALAEQLDDTCHVAVAELTGPVEADVVALNVPGRSERVTHETGARGAM